METANCNISEAVLSASNPAYPRYPLLWRTALRLGYAILLSQRRSFHRDACSGVADLSPPLQILGKAYIPSSEPCLVTANHYARPGFQAWWLALAISSAIREEIHWVITSAWTFDNRLRSTLGTPFTRWLFSRIARIYGFTNMPPMPPRPEELEARAKAVRQVIHVARQTPAAWIGMAPEGRDAPGGVLQPPPPGTGRFILQLADLGRVVLPVGVYEGSGGLCVSFGRHYRLTIPQGLSSKDRDALASQTVMSRIALQLPPGLRGVYAQPEDFHSPLGEVPDSETKGFAI